MRKCEKCNCLCDSGDLQNGICDDCRPQEQKQEENQEMLLRMMRSKTKQLRLEDILHENFQN